MRSGQLSLSSINDYEIGQRFALADPPLKVPCDYLAHRCEVVGSLDGLHLELAVLRSSRASVLKPYTRTDSVCALGGRDVEAGHRAGQLLEAELPSKLIDRIACACPSLERSQSQLLQQVTRVLLCKIYELAPRSPLRDLNLRTTQQLLEELAILEIERHEKITGALLH